MLRDSLIKKGFEMLKVHLKPRLPNLKNSYVPFRLMEGQNLIGFEYQILFR